jgi:transposase
VVACVLLTAPDGTPQRFVRTVGSRTTDLLALGDWLRFHGVPDGARERTGVRWRPGFTVLEEEEEEGRTLLLVNAQHRKAVPGRKTAVQDSAWVADPARATACARPAHGLCTASVVPPPPSRVLRDLTR